MTDNDHNRSNNSGTGAKALDRDDDLPTPSQGGSFGGTMQREIGARDEDKTAPDADGNTDSPTPTSVQGRDKPDGGDAPNLPNREGSSSSSGAQGSTSDHREGRKD